MWIGPDGTLRAITSSTELTATNINAILSDPNFELPVKKDIRTDKPIFLPEDLEMDDLLHYSIMIKGKIDGNSTGISRYRKSGEITRGRILINMPVLSMYKTIAAAAIEGFDDKRMILEITDSSGLSIKNIHKEESLWKYKLYTYDFMVPVSEAGKLHEYMLQDLNKYSAYEGSIRKSPVKCLALVRISETHNLLTKGGKSENKLSDPQNPYLRNLPITILVNRIKKIESISVPIIDETGYTNNIDIDLQSGFNDLLLLRKELNKHGLDLVERVRDLDMLYIKEKEKL